MQSGIDTPLDRERGCQTCFHEKRISKREDLQYCMVKSPTQATDKSQTDSEHFHFGIVTVIEVQWKGRKPASICVFGYKYREKPRVLVVLTWFCEDVEVIPVYALRSPTALDHTWKGCFWRGVYRAVRMYGWCVLVFFCCGTCIRRWEKWSWFVSPTEPLTSKGVWQYNMLQVYRYREMPSIM